MLEAAAPGRAGGEPARESTEAERLGHLALMVATGAATVPASNGGRHERVVFI
jgi:hypothetical protein